MIDTDAIMRKYQEPWHQPDWSEPWEQRESRYDFEPDPYAPLVGPPLRVDFPARLAPMLPEPERSYVRQGLSLVGLDEAGRGALAGPLFVAATVLTPELLDVPVADSKTLGERKRETVYDQMCRADVFTIVCCCATCDVNRFGIQEATRLAFISAVRAIGAVPDAVLLDGNPVGRLPFEYKAVVNGDSKCLSIAASSIAAKVCRDRMMRVLHTGWPEYGWRRNKGYPTKRHRETLRRLGPCELHRTRYAPVSYVLNRLI